MAEVVFIHGIGHQNSEESALCSEWAHAADIGLKAADYGQLPKLGDCDECSPRSAMAFYGKVFGGRRQMGSGEDSIADEDLALELVEAWLIRASARSPSPSVRKEAQIALQGLQSEELKAQGKGRMLGWVINKVGRLPGFAPFGMALATRFVVPSLNQVTSYLSDQETRGAVRQCALDKIDDRTKVIVGHSLGSIVAFEIAHLIPASIDLLLTIGSPLGIEALVFDRLEPRPPRFPPNVRRWVNIADKEDYVAAEPDLTPLFGDSVPKRSIFEGGWTVNNGAEPHSASFYLAQKEIGRPLGDAISP